MDLANILVKSKTVDIEYPGMPGFIVSLAYLTRDEIMSLKDKCTSQKFNRKSHKPEEETDNDLFQELYIKAVVKDWIGLKGRYILKMLPVDPSTVEEDGDVDYSESSAKILMLNCSNFDSWVSDMLEDVSNFTKAS